MTIPNAHAIAVLAVALVLLFYFFPFSEGRRQISDTNVLSGFGHPVLIAILRIPG